MHALITESTNLLKCVVPFVDLPGAGGAGEQLCGHRPRKGLRLPPDADGRRQDHGGGAAGGDDAGRGGNPAHAVRARLAAAVRAERAARHLRGRSAPPCAHATLQPLHQSHARACRSPGAGEWRPSFGLHCNTISNTRTTPELHSRQEHESANSRPG
eukprot:8453414-Pyramimonas_sp.AAC.1